MKNIVKRLHRDDRGNLGVLLLLVLLAFVAVLGLVWNSGEFATRQARIQAVADTSAHSSATWLSRSMNLVTSGNLVIAQNASGEVIWRSIEPTRRQVQKRFDDDRARAGQLIRGTTPGQADARRNDLEYFDELAGGNGFAAPGRMTTDNEALQAALQALIPDMNKAAAMTNYSVSDLDMAVRRNNVALQWILNTWINGGPGNPSTPVAGGVRAAVQRWSAGLHSRFNDVLNTLPTQQAVLDQFVAQAAPALAAVTPDVLAARRSEAFEYQKQVAARGPDDIEEQRTTLVGFYKSNITLATPTGTEENAPARVPTPVVPASFPEAWPHLDNIRVKYPAEAQAKFGTASPAMMIDPINVHINAESMLWHPNPTIPMPSFTVNGTPLSGQFRIDARESDWDRGWGFIYCAPLLRHVNDRVARDRRGLETFMRQIDAIRAGLRTRIYPPPATPEVTLPPSIPDPTAVVDANGIPNPPPIPLPPQTGARYVRPSGPIPPPGSTPPPARPNVTPAATPLPTFSKPNSLTAAQRAFIDDVNTRTKAFNDAMRDYCNEMFGLSGRLGGFNGSAASYYWSASHHFAVQAWRDHTEEARQYVLRQMGKSKEFMVLPTYSLREIPSWARSSMQASAKRYVFERVYSRNIGPVRQSVAHQIARILSAGMPMDPAYRDLLIQYGYSPQDANNIMRNSNYSAALARAYEIDAQFRISDSIVRQGAELISTEVAAEWVRRPWPYEIEPPLEPTPPNPGLRPSDRLTYFTVLTGAKTTADNVNSLFLPSLFKDTDKPVLAYAQAETFNWMEFDNNYGAGDRYDVLNDIGHGCASSSPMPWRISTRGGWSWQPRLSFSDGLTMAIDNNPQFRDYFQEAGVTGYDPDAIEKLNLH